MYVVGNTCLIVLTIAKSSGESGVVTFTFKTISPFGLICDRRVLQNCTVDK